MTPRQGRSQGDSPDSSAWPSLQARPNASCAAGIGHHHGRDLQNGTGIWWWPCTWMGQSTWRGARSSINPWGRQLESELESGAERGAKLCCDLTAENPETEISGKWATLVTLWFIVSGQSRPRSKGPTALAWRRAQRWGSVLLLLQRGTGFPDLLPWWTVTAPSRVV